MRLFLSYFVEFSNNNSSLEKDYLDDCTIEGQDQRPIIMITNDENIFLANNGYQKF